MNALPLSIPLPHRLPRYSVTRADDGWRVIDEWEGSILAILQLEDAARSVTQQLNRGICEAKDVAPDGRWTEN